MAELTPMMQQYRAVKEQNPIASCFSASGISMKCSRTTHASRPANWT